MYTLLLHFYEMVYTENSQNILARTVAAAMPNHKIQYQMILNNLNWAYYSKWSLNKQFIVAAFYTNSVYYNLILLVTKNLANKTIFSFTVKIHWDLLREHNAPKIEKQ